MLLLNECLLLLFISLSTKSGNFSIQRCMFVHVDIGGAYRCYLHTLRLIREPLECSADTLYVACHKYAFHFSGQEQLSLK
jgi:hypothetical protein